VAHALAQVGDRQLLLNRRGASHLRSSEVFATRTRLHHLVLALGLLGTLGAPGCVVHRYPPLGDVRTLGAGPIHGIVRVTRGAGLPSLDLSGVEIRDDTLFGWMRLRQSAGLVRTGVPLAEVRSISAKRVNWALTAVANLPLLVIVGGLAYQIACEMGLHSSGCMY
jgi:hypothetical protein